MLFGSPRHNHLLSSMEIRDVHVPRGAHSRGTSGHRRELMIIHCRPVCATLGIPLLYGLPRPENMVLMSKIGQGATWMVKAAS